jgi:hypothetical protein
VNLRISTTLVCSRAHYMKEGNVVNKYSMLAFALILALGLGTRANAQEEGKVVVIVPFDFVVSGKALPAGKYTVSRVLFGDSSSLIIRGDHDGALVLPTVFDDIPVENARLGFEHVDGAYLLNEVKTPIGTYSIGTSREAATLNRLAQAKMNGVTASGTP